MGQKVSKLLGNSQSQLPCLVLRVLIPNKEYGGHQPIAAVASGIKPSNPQIDCGPMTVRLKIPRPTTARITLS